MLRFAVAVVAALTLGAAPAIASTTVGTSDHANSFPFGAWARQGGVRFQQVFNASAFNGPTTFNSISFFKDIAVATGTSDTATYTISFSTTSRSSTTLSLTFNDNVTAPQKLFGTFTTAAAQPDVLSFIGTQFSYDPTMGNLLMDVTMDKLIQSGTGYPGFQASYGFGPTARVFSNDSTFGYADTLAPVVRFDLVNSAAVPEPATWAMMILGFSIIGYALRRKTVLRFV